MITARIVKRAVRMLSSHRTAVASGSGYLGHPKLLKDNVAAL